ncbi:hypothetical protein SAMN02745227_00655 [Anaerobranca californiensis DSM 14826]|jgi:hypothetical protein|uniref:Peptidase MA-like domain-containing protein n=1 Tax=Anaerobranca californiensis DSM 14826 TaxID=1120989 RepID=A0A1M6M4W9_9FIRM|nr:hypothetical protein [Anaerobranca californiensis]SHJ78343.1 hypothetical protein SAMN02745227_00655 [Anaerobranca californiensis DSM 14826]
MLSLNNKKGITVTTLLLGLLVTLNLLLFNWSRVEQVGISAIRNSMASYNRNIVYRNYQWLIGENVDVAFTEDDKVFSQFILDLAEESYAVLQSKYNFKPNRRPLVVIYPSYEQLLNSLGWDESNKASGVYQNATIKLVSPRDWYPVNIIEDIKSVYKNYGPLHHEMSHFFVDFITKGNYPDWYTEALAQLEELKYLNIQWIDESNQNPERLYSFSELTKNFYNLENQGLAYRQALTIGIFLEEVYGDEVHIKLLHQLARGNSFENAVNNLFGISLIEFERNYINWIELNWSKFF